MLGEDHLGDPGPANALLRLPQTPFREGIALYLHAPHLYPQNPAFSKLLPRLAGTLGLRNRLLLRRRTEESTVGD